MSASHFRKFRKLRSGTVCTANAWKGLEWFITVLTMAKGREPSKALLLLSRKIEESLDSILTQKFHCSDPLYPADSFRWTLSSILGESDEGLASMPVKVLQACLEPVLEGLRNVDAESLLNLVRIEKGGALLRDGIYVRPIHDDISPRKDNTTVRYIHLSETPGQYSIGIFVFPPNAKIPLHDHPGMCVLSRVLYGELERVSLDLTRESSIEKQISSSWYSKLKARASSFGSAPGSKRAFKNQSDHLVAPDCTALYPYEGNLHEFIAGPQGAAVLDILLPPYDGEHDRDCTFYEIYENFETDTTPNTGQVSCMIFPIDQPEDFHCVSGRYRDLGSE